MTWAASPQAPVQRPQQIDQLATVLVALLTMMAIGSFVLAVVLFGRAGVLHDPTSTDAEIWAAVNRGMHGKRLYELGILLTGITWLTWQRRYVGNVELLGRPTRYSQAWTIGGWLIPVANLIIPQQQLSD